MTARPMTAEAMLRHVRVVTKDNTVQLWLGATHIVNVKPDSVPAIALQAFAADQPHALASLRGMREALERIGRPRDCGCVPCRGQCTSQEALLIEAEAMRDLALAALSGIEPES